MHCRWRKTCHGTGSSRHLSRFWYYHQVLIDRLEAQFGVSDFCVQTAAGTSLSTSVNSHPTPQGSVLGTLLFTAYTSPVGGLISSHGVAYHKFTDDIQLSLRSTRPTPRPHFNVLADARQHFAPGSCWVSEWPAAEYQQVRGRDSGHACPAAFSCCCLVVDVAGTI